MYAFAIFLTMYWVIPHQVTNGLNPTLSELNEIWHTGWF